MSKAVAIPTIIALIIGIIVLGVLGYWYLTTSSKGGGVTSDSFCYSRLIQYCSDLSLGRTTVDFSKYAAGCDSYIGKPGWPSSAPTTAEQCKKQGIIGI